MKGEIGSKCRESKAVRYLQSENLNVSTHEVRDLAPYSGIACPEDLEGIRVHVREAIEQFRALTAEEVRKQREAWAAASNDPDAVFEYQPALEEEAFEAVAAFKERKGLAQGG